MRYLLFSMLICLGCASDYHALRPAEADKDCVSKLKPEGIKTAWYDAGIDVMGNHISGLLLFKNMADSSDRVVFTNEAGIKFLDFEWQDTGLFKVHYVISQLNKKAVIALLKKDFELIMGIPFKTLEWTAWKNGNELFYRTSQKKEKHYFITAQDCASLLRIESGSERKRKVTVWLYGNDNPPDSIRLQHHTFDMQILLKKMTKD